MQNYLKQEECCSPLGSPRMGRGVHGPVCDYISNLAMMVGSVPPTTSLLRKRKKRPSVGSTVICPPLVTEPPATVTTVATSAYSLSMSCTACCRYTMIDVGILGNDTTAVKPWFWLYVAFPYGMEAGEDFAEATNASATSGCGMMNCPASDCMGEDVDVMVYAIAYMPLSGLFPCGYLSTAVMATLVTLKFALADTP